MKAAASMKDVGVCMALFLEFFMTLEAFFSENPVCALAFSGGVDSAFLLYAGAKAGADIKAYYLKTPFQPEFERADALRLAGELKVELSLVPFDILSVPGIADNPADRCCLCKRTMFSQLKALAESEGRALLIDGTNASDREEERPGMIALRELGVRSPLRECGIDKAKVRALSREAGLFTWDKPSYSCLATRLSAGERITPAGLERIETAETRLSALGFRDFRVRVSGNSAKLQVTAAQMGTAFEKRADILAALGDMFESLTLDLKEREA